LPLEDIRPRRIPEGGDDEIDDRMEKQLDIEACADLKYDLFSANPDSGSEETIHSLTFFSVNLLF
jgi:hypothetical protein